MSRKQHGSNNWKKQRKRVANVKRRIRRKVLDFQHKITSWLTTEYEDVFVEYLNVKLMLEQSHNTRNKHDAAWSQFIKLLEYKVDLNGCYVEKLNPQACQKSVLNVVQSPTSHYGFEMSIVWVRTGWGLEFFD